MKESARYILQILIFLALILSVGTGGYLLIEEEIGVGQAFYTAITAISPTHFDESHILSLPGRYFTVVLSFCGFGAVVAFATQFARLVIQSELEGVGVFTRKQMRRRIHRMKNHYIVCGFGEIGGAICGEMRDQQLPFVVITDEESSIDVINREGYALVRGNPTADSSLKEAEIDRADGVIAVLADDSDNLFISLAARELNPKIFIIARGEDSSIEDRILRAGADIVVSPMKLGGRQIAELIKQQTNLSPTAAGSLMQSSVMGLGLTVFRHAENEPTTVGAVLDQSTGVGAAGIYRSSGAFDSTPTRDAIVQPNDVVVLIMKTDEGGGSFQKNLSGKTILLADDHRALRLLYSRKLASAGHEVIQAVDGDDALAKAHSHSPDLIVLDINMPRRDGYDVCAALRSDPNFSVVPIILYSGEETSEFVQRGRESGASLCIRKTSKSSELLARIEEAFLEFPADAPVKTTTAQNGNVPSDSSFRPVRSNDDYDFETALENIDGDRQLMGELISALLDETPRIMQAIENAIERKDFRTVRLQSHKLKSSVAIVGARGAENAAANLESLEIDAHPDKMAGLHSELRTQIGNLMLRLKEHSMLGVQGK